jgi:hypothetical protein
MKEINVGSFEIESGEVLVSDPCYEVDTWCNGSLSNVKKGKWKSYVVEEDRIMYLVAYHNKTKVPSYNSSMWKKSDIEVGVDSGQAGIYDRKYFKDDRIVNGLDRKHEEIICEDEPWYSFNCDRTLAKIGAGVIPYGVVSSSGYGDGCYICKTIKEGKEIVGILIDFKCEEMDE